MKGLKEIRAPRIEGDIPRPEIIITPRLDLAADLGVTTAALSQTIRIATLGDIDQNAANFSLSDRQIPIRVLLSEDSRRSLATLEILPVPTSTGVTLPLNSVDRMSVVLGKSVSVRVVLCGLRIIIKTNNFFLYKQKTANEMRISDWSSDVCSSDLADLGVTTAALSQTIRIATLGDIDQNAAKFSLSDRQIPIRVLLSEDSRRSLATLENLPVPTSTGVTVPLKSVAQIGFGAGPTELRRYNQTRRIVIGADLAPGLVTGDAQAKIDALPAVKTMPQGVRKVIQGDAKWQAEMIQNFAIAVVSGLMLVFATLVLLYRRFLSPLVNMSSLLLAPLGGLLGLLIAGMEISMPVYIGLLMLLGIVAKNSILLVDFAIEEMDHGIAKVDALIDAGRKRAQPIVMTTVAMVAGMVPTALSLSGDGAWRAPMGVVVIGGLILSTLLTLLIVPAGFSLADSIEKRLGRFFSSNLLTYRKGDDPKPHGAPAPEPAAPGRRGGAGKQDAGGQIGRADG